MNTTLTIVIQLIVKSLFAWWCYTLAKKQDRLTGFGILWGFLFGLFAVVGYYIAGNKKWVKETKTEPEE